MDLGSSAFVFASGLLPPRSTPLASKGTLGLAALAGARLVTIKLLGYPEHVTEYGVHWNFFATLLCIRVAVSLWRRWEPARTSSTSSWQFQLLYQLQAAALLGGVHEWLLSAQGGRQFVLHAPRGQGFFSDNREGILGLPGYFMVFLLAEWVRDSAKLHFPPPSSPLRVASNNKGNTGHATGAVGPSDRSDKMRSTSAAAATVPGNKLQHERPERTWAVLGCAGALLGGSAVLEYLLGQPPSRRLMNAPFVLLACAHSTLLLGTLSLVEACASGPMSSRLSDVLSRNMLGSFLVANLLTGAVNLSTDTLAWSDGAAAALLVCYLGAVVAVAVAMDGLQWRIKV
eukprot:TRINITY_DN1646_c0_g1_i1.p1 TRINITY_DN1646_c0_g1~~TRINITY_DN1646_c0_g1_i1.p1  ORF type:complete len:343 (-),score=75.91 TRINITY_DN1646_c0_g1_i1:959-1987(-)